MPERRCPNLPKPKTSTRCLRGSRTGRPDYDLFDPPYVEDPFGFWSVLRRSFVGTLTATRLGLHRDSHVRAGTHLARRLVGDLGSYSIAS
jgi:hypothetical protein